MVYRKPNTERRVAGEAAAGGIGLEGALLLKGLAD
jgi:hypothetical protein